MRVLPFFLFVGCATFDDVTDVTFSVTLPSMTPDCSSDVVDDSTQEIRLLSDLTADGTVCRGRIYGRQLLVDWRDVRNEIPLNSSTDWTRVTSEIQSLAVTAGDGVPSGTVVTVEQLVATESGDLFEYDGAPFDLVGTIGASIEGSSERISRSTITFGDTPPEDVLAAAQIVSNDPGPLATANTSYDNDEALELILVATIDVPTSELGKEGVSVRLDVMQEFSYAADVRLGGSSD